MRVQPRRSSAGCRALGLGMAEGGLQAAPCMEVPPERTRLAAMQASVRPQHCRRSAQNGPQQQRMRARQVQRTLAAQDKVLYMP